MREARGEVHDSDLLVVGGMGHASQIALALVGDTIAMREENAAKEPAQAGKRKRQVMQKPQNLTAASQAICLRTLETQSTLTKSSSLKKHQTRPLGKPLRWHLV